MDLFKGSRLYMNPFKPQPVHPDDYHKFSELVPSRVIFASESETKAKIYATFSGIISFDVLSTPEKKDLIIQLRDSIEPETLKEKAYLYKFNSEAPGWKFIEQSGEWYSTSEQVPLDIKEYTREELYKELRENPEITFKEKFQEKEDITIF